MTEPARPQLVRAVGLFSLTAIAVNGMVGLGIFVLPAQVRPVRDRHLGWARRL